MDRHNNKSKYGVLGHIMGHFTNFFGITEVGGENSVYGNVGSIYYRGVFHFKNNTCAYLIKATVLKLLIYVNPWHILIFLNLLPGTRDRCHYGHPIDSDKWNFHTSLSS